MADIIKSADNLIIGFEDHNGKTQYMTALPNPKTNLTADSVRAAAEYIVEHGIFLDKSGASYTSVVTAYRETKSSRSLDIRPDMV